MIRVNSVVALFATLCVGFSGPVDACTRAVYLGPQGQTVTGRSMDWVEDMQTNLWVFPREMKRDGGLGKGSLEWTSKYGSVVASVYEGGTADGMNERGLVANLLYLAESEYPAVDDPRPGVSITAWAQYLLDNFATVEEAVAEMKKDGFRVVAVDAPNGMKGTVHLSISDATGDSAIFEYVDGKLVIHHGKEYQVMTNSPTYDKQLAINEYWKEFDGAVMLPGTVRAADRFARASYYIKACHPDRRPARSRCRRVQRDAQRERASRHPQEGSAQSLVDALANRRRPEEPCLLLRRHRQPRPAMGEAGRDLDFAGIGRAETDDGRQSRVGGRPDGQLQDGRAVQVPFPGGALNAPPLGWRLFSPQLEKELEKGPWKRRPGSITNPIIA